MIDSGEAREYGEGAEDLFKEALDYQLKRQVHAVPFVRAAFVICAIGILLVVVASFLS